MIDSNIIEVSDNELETDDDKFDVDINASVVNNDEFEEETL